MKALPSSYNRDIQEDKKALFDSVETIQSALEVFAAMLPELKINRKRMENAARDSSLLATDLAEYLVKKGTPFREAHQIVGELVVHSIAKSVPLDQIAVAEMKKFSPHFDDDVAKIFDVPRFAGTATRDRRFVAREHRGADQALAQIGGVICSGRRAACIARGFAADTAASTV